MADDTRLADACLLLNFSSRRDTQNSNNDSSINVKKPLKLVAVHLGAGNSHNEIASLQLAKRICEEVMLQMKPPQSISKRKQSSHCYTSQTQQGGRCSDYHVNEDQMTAELAVVQLIKRMEDHQMLNCGYGSNLNIRGQVECDASLMSDKTQMWTGVGAVSGCKNPILLAKALYDHRITPRPLGLVQPNLLVGPGAKQWMREHCPHLVLMDSKMISSRSFSTYQKLKSKYDAAIKASAQENAGYPTTNFLTSSSAKYIGGAKINFSGAKQSKQSEKTTIDLSLSNNSTTSTSLDHGFYCISTGNNLKREPSFASASLEDKITNEKVNLSFAETEVHDAETIFELPSSPHDLRLDTVGAIAVDSDNNFASAISSGGLLLKYKGRIGQAAVPGAGCWSEDFVAVTTTGVGEYLTLSLFAKKFYDKMQTLRLLYDLGLVDKKPDLSNLFNCIMDECFEDLMKSAALTHVSSTDRLAGMLSVSSLNSKDSTKRIDDKDIYLSYAHNTSSMCLGYMTCNDKIGHSIVSRRPDKNDGRALVRTMKFSLDPSAYGDDGYYENQIKS